MYRRVEGVLCDIESCTIWIVSSVNLKYKNMKKENKRYVLSLLVENKMGVLVKVVGLFSLRGYNIDSLNVSTTDNSKISRITVVVHGSSEVIEHITKHLHKLINTIKVVVMSEKDCLEKELCFVRINAIANKRDEILRLLDAHEAKIEKVGKNFILASTVMPEESTDVFLSLVRPFGILELARSGVVAI